MASKYRMNVSLNEDPNFLDIRISHYDFWHPVMLEYKVSLRDYHANKLPEYLFTKAPGHEYGVKAVITGDGTRNTNPKFIDEAIHDYGFTDPIFEKLTLPPPELPNIAYATHYPRIEAILRPE